MTQPKERPILFSAPMVRAILAGEKTVTRRPVKPYQQPELMEDGTWFAIAQKHRRYGFGVSGADADACAAALAASLCCPYGQPGDRLWVRESWEDVHPVQVSSSRYSQEGRAGIPGPSGVTYQTIYRADGPYPQVFHTHKHPYRTLEPDPDHGFKGPADNGYTGWTPSIHMPRWASRILLEITDVRVERVQEISLRQVEAEGCEVRQFWLFGADSNERQRIGANVFKGLWESINGAGTWSANPWVWVVEFKRVMP